MTSRWIGLAAPLALSGCTTAGAAPGLCQPEGGQAFIGRTADAETGTAILRATGSRTLRWAPPGAMLTMDFQDARVTVSYDEARAITRVTCG